MQGQIDPTKINQSRVDTAQEISPDGGIIQQAAAPQGGRAPVARETPPANPDSIMENLEQVDGTAQQQSGDGEPSAFNLGDFLKVKGEDVPEPVAPVVKPAADATKTPDNVVTLPAATQASATAA